MTSEEIVSAFCESFAKNDLDETMQWIGDDCLYHNIPLEPMRGAAAIRQVLGGFVQQLGSLRFEVLHQVARGEIVMNERVDHFTPPQGKPFGLPVVGVFEVRDGKIRGWRDYFDVRQFEERSGIKL